MLLAPNVHLPSAIHPKTFQPSVLAPGYTALFLSLITLPTNLLTCLPFLYLSVYFEIVV